VNAGALMGSHGLMRGHWLVGESWIVGRAMICCLATSVNVLEGHGYTTWSNHAELILKGCQTGSNLTRWRKHLAQVWPFLRGSGL